MGQFSWITQDTKESIRESYGCGSKRKTSAWMHDNKGRKWHEESYEGYGVFGGKDYYVLLAEMNGIPRENLTIHEYRSKGIDLAFSGEHYLAPNLTRKEDWEWIDEEPMHCPNQGWSDYK